MESVVGQVKSKKKINVHKFTRNGGGVAYNETHVIMLRISRRSTCRPIKTSLQEAHVHTTETPFMVYRRDG